MTLTGYKRSDGRVGFRNYVLVVPMTGCQMLSAQRIADRVPGATCCAHPHGCDLQGPDFELFGTILEQFCTHPNVGGVVFLAMGFTGPAKSPLFDQLNLELSERGNVCIDDNHMSNAEGVFASGDMSLGQSLIVSALADGRKTAVGIIRYLEQKR